jgi:hypothetical protein
VFAHVPVTVIQEYTDWVRPLSRFFKIEFEREATWATRKFVPFVMQRISVAVQIAAATEIRQALGRGMGPDSA